MKESCWRNLSSDGRLEKVPFNVSSCTADGEMEVRGMCNMRFDFWDQSGLVTVIVVSDSSCSNNCLLGLNAVRAWPAMNHVVELMREADGVTFKQTAIGLCLDANQVTISRINTSLVDCIFQPSCKASNDTIVLRSISMAKSMEVEQVDEDRFLAEFVDNEVRAERAIELLSFVQPCVRAVQVNSLQSASEQGALPTAKNDIEKAILQQFPNIVAQPDSSLGQVVGFEHKIELVPEARPFKLPLRTAPYHLKKELESNLRTLLDRGIIVKSKSPFASPIVLVRKKTGELRLCVDYRRLNALTIRGSWPLPRIDELINKLGTSTRFTTLDLADGYYQIPIRTDDRSKTAFNTEFGLFEFTVMPFGLTNAPATFQQMMEEVLARHIEQGRAGVNVDDVMVHSLVAESHREDVVAVCHDINKAALRIKWTKCRFDQLEVEYLGYLIGKGRIVPSTRAAAAIDILLISEVPVDDQG